LFNDGKDVEREREREREREKEKEREREQAYNDNYDRNSSNGRAPNHVGINSVTME